MTTDLAVVERVLWVMAACMALQTLLFLGAAVGALVAWRRANQAFEEAKVALNVQIAALQGHIDRIANTVDEVAGVVSRSTTAMGDVVSDVRDAMGTVRSSVGSVASVVMAPRAAVAVSVLRGIQTWRKRRASQRVVDTMASEV